MFYFNGLKYEVMIGSLAPFRGILQRRTSGGLG